MAYTTIDDPSAYFQSHTFTKSAGTGSTTFTGYSDLQPDFLWTKSRTNADSHELWDSSRGVNSTLFSDSSSAEDTAANRITSFNTDGYSWGNAGNHNAAGSIAAWAWKANGGTTSSNTDGTLTSTVQANTTAGFSIVTYANPSTTDSTIGHGLGVKPDMIIFKNRDTAVDWHVAHKDLTSYATYGLSLSTNLAQGSSPNAMNSTEPTSSVFSVGGVSATGSNSDDMVAYCFAGKQGYSKFGKYVGNGNVNGTFVYTGFKPAFVMFKRIDTSRSWLILDTKRDEFNVISNHLYPNLTNVEYTTEEMMDSVSNGFKIRNTNLLTNGSGSTYIYAAFAENPFVTSTGIPTTAR